MVLDRRSRSDQETNEAGLKAVKGGRGKGQGGEREDEDRKGVVGDDDNDSFVRLEVCPLFAEVRKGKHPGEDLGVAALAGEKDWVAGRGR